MQKLVKRTAQAQRQAARRAQDMTKRQEAEIRRRAKGSIKEANTEVRQQLKAARQSWRDDWTMGPLAPRRDLGFNNYGVVTNRMRVDWTQGGVNRAPPAVVEKRCAWAGGSKQLSLAPGDRVVILDGPDKDQVDQIESVDALNGTVKLSKSHRALIRDTESSPMRATPLPIPVSSVRLVYPLPHPTTKQVRDVIINELKAVAPNMQSENMTLDRWEAGNKWDRMVPGINVIIPWPEVKAPTFDMTKADTARDEVERRTFYFGLLSPPVPEHIIDELRNKYSKFRTRHESWYIEQVEAKAAAKEQLKEPDESMQTALADFHAMRRELRDSTPEPQLSEPMLERLGKIMAEKKKAALQEAGVSEVPDPAGPAPRPRAQERANL